MKPTTVTSLETAVLLTKIEGTVRLIAILATFMAWYSLAAVGLVVFLASPQRLELAYQALSAAGLAPLAAVVATWRGAEWAIARWMNAYVRKHLEVP